MNFSHANPIAVREWPTLVVGIGLVHGLLVIIDLSYCGCNVTITICLFIVQEWGEVMLTQLFRRIHVLIMSACALPHLRTCRRRVMP